jgi:hypothetical protein
MPPFVTRQRIRIRIRKASPLDDDSLLYNRDMPEQGVVDGTAAFYEVQEILDFFFIRIRPDVDGVTDFMQSRPNPILAPQKSVGIQVSLEFNTEFLNLDLPGPG